MTEVPPPRIRVNADACPSPIRDILFRAAERTRVQVTLVANQWLSTLGSRFIRALQVQGGYDVADDAIAERLSIRTFMEELRGAGVQTGGQRQRHAQQSRLENHDARFAQASPY